MSFTLLPILRCIGVLFLSLHLAAATPYKPQTVDCPSSPLVRDATGISSDEQSYVTQRQKKAATALKSWLDSTGASFPAPPNNYPNVGLTTSGGGLRSLLTGAGVHKALDGDDSSVSTSGLYQGLTYEAGLSGGGWMLSSFAGNNWPTVSSLVKNLWTQAFIDTLADPPHFSDVQLQLGLDVFGKHQAGFDVGLTDLYGRLLGYQLLYSTKGGVDETVSGLVSMGKFKGHEVPYPILTALGTPPGQLLPSFNGTQYEIHPYEFGSWDNGVKAFTPMKYLGSDLVGGKPKSSSKCVTGFDSLDFALGTSSSIFSALKQAGAASTPDVQRLVSALKLLQLPINPGIFFANYPNPFFKYQPSDVVEDLPSLNLVDGGDDQPDQGDPIWPMLHRDVDVLLVGANSADTADNFPSGVEIHNTYVRAQAVGLSRMPFIPGPGVFKSEGLLERATFFGCDDPNTMTIVYLPNRKITFDSGKSTLKLMYTKEQTASMIENGMQIATEAGSKDWGVCLGCAIMMKSGGKLPSDCTACFKKYCFKGSQSGTGQSNGGSSSGGGSSGGSSNGGSSQGSGSGGSSQGSGSGGSSQGSGSGGSSQGSGSGGSSQGSGSGGSSAASSQSGNLILTLSLLGICQATIMALL